LGELLLVRLPFGLADRPRVIILQLLVENTHFLALWSRYKLSINEADQFVAGFLELGEDRRLVALELLSPPRFR
jgi:hypothetical protein